MDRVSWRAPVCLARGVGRGGRAARGRRGGRLPLRRGRSRSPAASAFRPGPAHTRPVLLSAAPLPVTSARAGVQMGVLGLGGGTRRRRGAVAGGGGHSDRSPQPPRDFFRGLHQTPPPPSLRPCVRDNGATRCVLMHHGPRASVHTAPWFFGGGGSHDGTLSHLFCPPPPPPPLHSTKKWRKSGKAPTASSTKPSTETPAPPWPSKRFAWSKRRRASRRPPSAKSPFSKNCATPTSSG